MFELFLVNIVVLVQKLRRCSEFLAKANLIIL